MPGANTLNVLAFLVENVMDLTKHEALSTIKALYGYELLCKRLEIEFKHAGLRQRFEAWLASGDEAHEEEEAADQPNDNSSVDLSGVSTDMLDSLPDLDAVAVSTSTANSGTQHMLGFDSSGSGFEAWFGPTNIGPITHVWRHEDTLILAEDLAGQNVTHNFNVDSWPDEWIRAISPPGQWLKVLP